MYLKVLLQHNQVEYLEESSEYIVRKCWKTESNVEPTLGNSIMMGSEMQGNIALCVTLIIHNYLSCDLTMESHLS